MIKKPIELENVNNNEEFYNLVMQLALIRRESENNSPTII